MHPIPVRFGDLEDPQGLRHPGIVDHHIDATECIDRTSDHLVDVGEFRHVGLNRQAAASLLTDLRFDLTQSYAVHLDRRDIRALFSETHRDGAPHAASGAGHHGHCIDESHAVPLVVSRGHLPAGPLLSAAATAEKLSQVPRFLLESR